MKDAQKEEFSMDLEFLLRQSDDWRKFCLVLSASQATLLKMLRLRKKQRINFWILSQINFF
jgi:hypothetical protein